MTHDVLQETRQRPDTKVPCAGACNSSENYYQGVVAWALGCFSLAHQVPGDTVGLWHPFTSEECLVIFAHNYMNGLAHRELAQLKNLLGDTDGERSKLLAEIERYRRKTKTFHRKFFTIPNASHMATEASTCLSSIKMSTAGILCFARADFSGKGLKTDILLSQTHPHIEELLLSRNSLNSSDFLERFTTLVHLDFSHNLLQVLPQIPFNFLASADFSHNQISGTFALNAPRLVQLSLAHNSLADAGEAALPSLKILNIAHNRLTRLNFAQSLPQLRELYAGHNQVKDAEGLDGHASLEVAHLRANHITALPRMSCPRLRVLNLRQNAITDHVPLLEILQGGGLPQLSDVSLLENEGMELDAETARTLLAGTLKRFNKQTLKDISPD